MDEANIAKKGLNADQLAVPAIVADAGKAIEKAATEKLSKQVEAENQKIEMERQEIRKKREAYAKRMAERRDILVKKYRPRIQNAINAFEELLIFFKQFPDGIKFFGKDAQYRDTLQILNNPISIQIGAYRLEYLDYDHRNHNILIFNEPPSFSRKYFPTIYKLISSPEPKDKLIINISRNKYKETIDYYVNRALAEIINGGNADRWERRMVYLGNLPLELIDLISDPLKVEQKVNETIVTFTNEEYKASVPGLELQIQELKSKLNNYTYQEYSLTQLPDWMRNPDLNYSD